MVELRSCEHVPNINVTNFGRSDCLFLWLCQTLSWVPHSWGETSRLTETWCDCEWTHCKCRPLAISRHLWKCSLALHDREFPLAPFPLWFSIIYECSSSGKGCHPPTPTSRFLSVYMTSLGWQQSSNFGMYLQQGKTHQGGKTNARKHTY